MADLSQFIKINSAALTKQYRRGSGIALSKDTIQLQNLSPSMDIVASLQGISGISFSPQTVTIPRNGSVSIDIVYNTSQFENLNDGINSINTIINLSAVGVSIPLATPLPTPTPIQTIGLTVIATFGNFMGTDGSTNYRVIAPADGSPSVVGVSARLLINGVANPIQPSQAQSLQWFLTGPGISNSPVGTGNDISVSLPFLGVFAVSAVLGNLTAQVSILVDKLPTIPTIVTPLPTAADISGTIGTTRRVFVTPTPTPTPTPFGGGGGPGSGGPPLGTT